MLTLVETLFKVFIINFKC